MFPFVSASPSFILSFRLHMQQVPCVADRCKENLGGPLAEHQVKTCVDVWCHCGKVLWYIHIYTCYSQGSEHLCNKGCILICLYPWNSSFLCRKASLHKWAAMLYDSPTCSLIGAIVFQWHIPAFLHSVEREPADGHISTPRFTRMSAGMMTGMFRSHLFSRW